MPTCCQEVASTWPSGVVVANTAPDLRRLLPDTTCLYDAVLLGINTVNDGQGGAFYYDSTSTQADDSYSCFKPDSVGVSDAGRWLRSF